MGQSVKKPKDLTIHAYATTTPANRAPRPVAASIANRGRLTNIFSEARH